MKPLSSIAMRRLSSIACLLLGGCAPVHDGQVSDHFDGTQFHNNVPVQKSLRDVVRWGLTRDAAEWSEPPPFTPVAPAARVDAGVTITPVNHATLLIQAPGLNLLTDPVWSDRCFPVQWAGPKRHHPPAVDFDALPAIDAVVISHNHYDHMDLGSIARLEAAHAPAWIVPLNNAHTLIDAGVDPARITELDWWQAADVATATVHAVPAQHWSRRGLLDSRRDLWAGFVVQTAAGDVLFAGDTGYGPHFKAIRERLGTPDWALLPIGAYEPRWFMRAQHMNPADAVIAWADLGRPRTLGMHWGTWQLTDESRTAPVQELAAALVDEAPDAAARFVAAQPGAQYAE